MNRAAGEGPYAEFWVLHLSWQPLSGAQAAGRRRKRASGKTDNLDIKQD